MSNFYALIMRMLMHSSFEIMEFSQSYDHFYFLALENDFKVKVVKFVIKVLDHCPNLYIYIIYNICKNAQTSILRITYLSSNIPSKIFYSLFGAEILQIARATVISPSHAFKASSLLLINRLIKQVSKPK